MTCRVDAVDIIFIIYFYVEDFPLVWLIPFFNKLPFEPFRIVLLVFWSFIGWIFYNVEYIESVKVSMIIVYFPFSISGFCLDEVFKDILKIFFIKQWFFFKKC